VILEVARRTLEGAQAARHGTRAAPAPVDDDGRADQAAEQEAQLAAAGAVRHYVARW
jgi:hypothetical protein